MFVFNVYDLEIKKYLSWNVIRDTCKDLKLKTVPFIEERTFDFEDIDDLRKYAEGNYDNGHPREGVVIRLIGNDIYTPPPEYKMSNQASFKIINEAYRVATE